MSDVTLPTAEEIRQLPRWAQVAFAARCAKRTILKLQNFCEQWQHFVFRIPYEVVEHAAFVTEQAAASATSAKNAAIAAETAVVNFAGSARSVADSEYIGSGEEADRYAHVAYLARAVAAAAGAVYTQADEKAATAANAAANPQSIPLIRQDFQRLLDESRRQKWTDDTPIPPSVFGPIDEDADPPVEVVETAEPFRSPQFKLIVESYAADGVDPQEVRKRLVALFRELNEYSLRKWGKGLTIDEFTQYLLAGVPAGVPS